MDKKKHTEVYLSLWIVSGKSEIWWVGEPDAALSTEQKRKIRNVSTNKVIKLFLPFNENSNLWGGKRNQKTVCWLQEHMRWDGTVGIL